MLHSPIGEYSIKKLSHLTAIMYPIFHVVHDEVLDFQVSMGRRYFMSHLCHRWFLQKKFIPDIHMNVWLENHKKLVQITTESSYSF